MTRHFVFLAIFLVALERHISRCADVNINYRRGFSLEASSLLFLAYSLRLNLLQPQSSAGGSLSLFRRLRRAALRLWRIFSFAFKPYDVLTPLLLSLSATTKVCGKSVSTIGWLLHRRLLALICHPKRFSVQLEMQYRPN